MQKKPLDDFAAWLATPLGRYLTAAEQAWFDRVSSDIFGYKAVQLELPDMDCLRSNRMPWRIHAGQAAGGVVRCIPEQLPFDEQSIDLIALPHVLDFSDDPHTVLREAARVLRPEGSLLISGFNPWSLWGLRRLLKSGDHHGAPWQGNALALPRLKDWLALLGLETQGGEFLCYSLPVQREGWLSKTRFIESAGDRWWPAGGGVYCLQVVKRVQGVRLIEPQWRRVPSRRSKPAVIVERSELGDK